ncbi:MAG TPA: hypothetical protein VGS12_16550 [Caulobacteraceae bacterium]|nr:hypothetical protein [Caulobacteraceae bacterium]
MPDTADLAPSRDPAVYGRTRILSPAFWAMMGFAVLCILSGVAVVTVIPRWTSSLNRPPPAPAPAAPPALETPAPAAAAPLAVAAPPASDLAGLEGRVDTLESGQSRALAAAAAALAAADLTEAASSGRPFADELAAAERVLPGSPELTALRPLARAGAPSRAALAADFSDLAAQASVAARRPAKGASVLAQIGYALSRIVDIRRVDANAKGPDALIARAERAAATGDLEAAIDLVGALPPQARAPLQPWLAQARARIALDRTLAALRLQALSGLAQAQGAAA